MLADSLVHKCQDFSRCAAHHRPVTDQDISYHHKQCSGDSLARNISDYQSQMILIDQEEIVEITAHLPCRCHGSKDIQVFPVRERREYIGNGIFLDSAGQGKFCSDPFLLGSNGSKVIHIGYHVLFHGIDGTGKAGYLRIPADISQFLTPGILPGKTGRLFRNLPDRFHELLPEIACCKQCGNRRHNHRNDPDGNQIRAPRIINLPDRPLYAENSFHFSGRILNRYHGSDMGMHPVLCTSAENRLMFGLLFVQRSVFLPVFVIGSVPPVSAFPDCECGVVHFIVHGIENGDKPSVITFIHPDHIYQ